MGDTYGYIDMKGKVTIKPKFDDAKSFSERLAKVGIGRRSSRKFGYIGKTGKVFVEPQFDWASCFSEGLAGVEEEEEFEI